jgi:pimeloyl-ACP methyl ester carboxylesterase
MLRFATRNGVRLAYEDTGIPLRSLGTLILIHGWADRHELFAPMMRHFQARYRIIAVDLRGHGQSGKPNAGYEVSTLAEDVAQICRSIAGKRTLIGHSLGGAVALEMASRHSEQVASVVAIEGAFLFPATAREAMKPLGEALRGPQWKQAMRGFIDSCYLPTDDPALRQYSYRELDRLPQHVHTGVFEGVMGWNAEKAARSCKTPLLYIEGGSGLADLERLKTLCPQTVVGQTVGLSHMSIVAEPAQTAAMIDRFLLLQRGNSKTGKAKSL